MQKLIGMKFIKYKNIKILKQQKHKKISKQQKHKNFKKTKTNKYRFNKVNKNFEEK